MLHDVCLYRTCWGVLLLIQGIKFKGKGGGGGDCRKCFKGTRRGIRLPFIDVSPVTFILLLRVPVPCLAGLMP